MIGRQILRQPSWLIMLTIASALLVGCANWTAFVETIIDLNAGRAGWPAELERARLWYEPHLDRIHEDSVTRHADLIQLEQIENEMVVRVVRTVIGFLPFAGKTANVAYADLRAFGWVRQSVRGESPPTKLCRPYSIRAMISSGSNHPS
jgi:hypothetical protein